MHAIWSGEWLQVLEWTTLIDEFQFHKAEIQLICELITRLEDAHVMIHS